MPGAGRIPLETIVRTAAATGYDGPHVIEIFSSESLPRSLWRGDLDALLDASIAGCENLCSRIDAGDRCVAR